MSSDTLEILDSNIVIVLEEPLKQTIKAAELLDNPTFASLMKKPLTLSQGVSIDAALGTGMGMFQIESMRSQKIVSLATLRIEAHDRSGEKEIERAGIPETITALVEILEINQAKAIGANWEITFKTSDSKTASKAIAEKLLLSNTGFLPNGMTTLGGAARLYLTDASGMRYTLVLEPRGQDLETDVIWMTCNANFTNPDNLSIELLKEMFQQSYRLLFEVKESLFPDS